MNFNTLIIPYNENGRTIGGQIKWLKGKGIPDNIIDHVMTSVYKEVEDGKKFDSGSLLDQYLFKVAREAFDIELQEQLEKRISTIANTLDSDWNKLTKWQKIKQVISGKA